MFAARARAPSAFDRTEFGAPAGGCFAIDSRMPPMRIRERDAASATTVSATWSSWCREPGDRTLPLLLDVPVAIGLQRARRRNEGTGIERPTRIVLSCSVRNSLSACAPLTWRARRRSPSACAVIDADRIGGRGHGTNHLSAAGESMDFLSADSLPWLHGPQQRLRESVSARRLPHALLLLSVPGLGAEQLANWIAALTLCESDAAAPMRRLRLVPLVARRQPSGLLRGANRGGCAADQGGSDSRSDRIVVALELSRRLQGRDRRRCGSTQCKRRQRLFEDTGGADGQYAADHGRRNRAIACRRPSPAAACACRCVRRARRAAVAWLEARGQSRQNWDAALALAGDAPLLALEIDSVGIAALEKEMQEDLE